MSKQDSYAAWQQKRGSEELRQMASEQQTADEIVVTQEDRDFEGALMRRINAGNYLGHDFARDIARHRIASIAAARPMIEAEERERCATVAEEIGRKGISEHDNPLGHEFNRIANVAAKHIALAIRAMGVER